MTSALPRRFAALGLLCLTGTAWAENSPPAIRDDAGLFHADAIARAETRIDALHRDTGHHLFVRTVAAPSERNHLWVLRTPRVNRLLDEQARALADQAGAEGIYVIVCRKPRDVRVVVRPGNDPYFSRHDAGALRDAVVRHLREDGADDALLRSVDWVHETLQNNLARGPTSPGLSGFTLAGLLAGGVILWLILSAIRAKTRAGHPVEDDPAEQARRGPALLGAMFGFPAGKWIYDKLYPYSSGEAVPLADPEPAAPSEDAAMMKVSDAS